MANVQQSVGELMQIDGAICAAVVDASSGMLLGSAGSGIDMTLAAAGNTEVVRAKMRTIASLKSGDSIEDILITLGKQYHVIRPIASANGLFIYMVLDKNRANLALARHKTVEVERGLKL